MKKRLFITVLLVVLLGFSAKSQSGVYLNVASFSGNKLAYEDKGAGKHIHIHDFFWGMPEIKVSHGGRKYTLKKSELYGYRDCKNNVYRFYNNTEYRIAEAGSIFVYVQEKNIAQSKGFIVVNEYYFSAAPDGDILPLTLANLKYEYRGNDKFLAAIEYSLDDGSVREYDNGHGQFKVNEMYTKAAK